MLANSKTVDSVKFLTQSPVRVQILEVLREEGEMSKSELMDRFDVSRVTVQRNVKALEERDWIDNSHSTYTITPLGEMIIDEVSPLTESIEIARKLRPFLKWIPRDSFDLDPRTLADATVLSFDPTEPCNWVNHHIDRLKSISYARMALPLIDEEWWEVTTERLLDDELEVEFVADLDVADTLRTDPRYSETIEQLLTTNRFTLFVYDGQLSYGIGLYDQHVQMIVVDDEMPQALVETESDAVYDWAEAKFEFYRTQAEPFVF